MDGLVKPPMILAENPRPESTQEEENDPENETLHEEAEGRQVSELFFSKAPIYFSVVVAHSLVLGGDGSVDDFSFRKCVDHILPLPENMQVKHEANKDLPGGGKGGGGGKSRGHVAT
ncbi:hypothetical protein HAX54_009812 [Datura stramonium]|uniref:Uncharacterized protein n=1 Tax=Datura stramonium TaxID=4076 RepID=A0ABS8TGN6_DATST|nr:hypothetical protein [Datura stramonium]